MKKKIKDLKNPDLSLICMTISDFHNCPLHRIVNGDTLLCLKGVIELTLSSDWPQILEQEVEI